MNNQQNKPDASTKEVIIEVDRDGYANIVQCPEGIKVTIRKLYLSRQDIPDEEEL